VGRTGKLGVSDTAELWRSWPRPRDHSARQAVSRPPARLLSRPNTAPTVPRRPEAPRTLAPPDHQYPRAPRVRPARGSKHP